MHSVFLRARFDLGVFLPGKDCVALIWCDDSIVGLSCLFLFSVISFLGASFGLLSYRGGLKVSAFRRANNGPKISQRLSTVELDNS